MAGRSVGWLCLSLAGFTGCASVSLNAGFAEVSAAVEEHAAAKIGWSRGTELDSEAAEKLRVLLHKKLVADDAVQIAMLNNRDLQAIYSDRPWAGPGRSGPGRAVQGPGLRRGRAMVKVRDRLKNYDEDPGWYQHPPGTVALKATDSDLARDGINPIEPPAAGSPSFLVPAVTRPAGANPTRDTDRKREDAR